MTKLLTFGCLMVFMTLSAKAQDFGLSFSYFIPKNGTFSIPISPFSIRDVGLSIGNHLGVRTGATLFWMGGLNITGLPFQSKKSLTGPHFSVFIPAEIIFPFDIKKSTLIIKGGGFGFYGFAHRLNAGNIDRALLQHEQWDVVTSNLTFNNHPGWGYLCGIELQTPYNKSYGITIQVNYLWGKASFPLKGSYTGGTLSSPLRTVTVDYRNAKIDFTGLEISFGVTLLDNNSR